MDRTVDIQYQIMAMSMMDRRTSGHAHISISLALSGFSLQRASDAEQRLDKVLKKQSSCRLFKTPQHTYNAM